MCLIHVYVGVCGCLMHVYVGVCVCLIHVYVGVCVCLIHVYVGVCVCLIHVYVGVCLFNTCSVWHDNTGPSPEPGPGDDVYVGTTCQVLICMLMCMLEPPVRC